MNFDGKAYVKNITTRMFVSQHGQASVLKKHINKTLIGNRNSYNVAVRKKVPTNTKTFNYIKFINRDCRIPYTVQVYNDNNIRCNLKSKKFIIVRSIINAKPNFSYKTPKIYVSRLQPTNIKYNPGRAIVIDSEKKRLVTNLPSVTVNVNSKVEFIIPDKVSHYSDMSLVIQKNCFMEIKIPETVSEVINLPDDLMYLSGHIKGTFTKSGEYNIKIKYPDGEQILNIIVPYYQRLL